MNLKALSNWLSAACAVLIMVLLVKQHHQTKTISTLQAELRAVAQASDRHLKEQATNFGKMHQHLDDLVATGALFPNKSKPASEALARAVSAEKSGDLNLAKIYYLSAINHAPSDFAPLDSYAKVVLRDGSATVEDLARLKSVLQISLYQVPPPRITNVLGLLNEAVQREEAVIAAQIPKTTSINWAENFRHLKDSNSLENSWARPKELTKRWETLSEIVGALREEQPGSDLVQQAERHLEVTENAIAAVRLVNVMDLILKALDSSPVAEKAVSLLQTAEGIVAQLWGIDASGWPDSLRAKVDGYPNDIKNRVERVAELKSQPFLLEVRRILSEVKSYESRNQKGKYQTALLFHDRCIEEIRKALSNISSKAGREEAEKILQDIGRLAVKAKGKQFDEYQKWALERCRNAFNSYRNETSLSDEEAHRFFRNNELATIDQTLLSPEVSRVFNDVVAKLTAELDGTGAFTLYKECAETNKRKLEDF